MDNTENMEVPYNRPEESVDSEQTKIFDTEEAKDNVVDSNTKESELDNVETTTLSGTFQREPHTEVSDAKNPGDFSNGKSDSVQTETTDPPVNDCSSENREDGKGNATECIMCNEETSQEDEKQDLNTCDDLGTQQKENTLKTAGTLVINDGNASNLDSQEKRESRPSSPVECNTSESSIYSDSDSENGESFEKDSKLPSHGSMQGASASVELPDCNMTNTEKQRVPSHQTQESVVDLKKSKEQDVETTTNGDSDVITDDKEDNTGNVDKSKVHDMETTTNGVAEKSEVTNGEKSTSTSVAETTPEGTSSTSSSRNNGVVPTEPGNLNTELTVSGDSAESCPVESTSESESSGDKGIVPEEEESTRRGSNECHLASGFLSGDPGESESIGQGFIKVAMEQLLRAVASGEGMAILHDTSTEEEENEEEEEEEEEEGTRWPYRKAGYTVVINKGKLCASSSEEKAEVIMKSGTEFFLLIGNDNDHAAEVDITFGGIYLGVWLVEANRSRPLFVQGSSWTAGRLRFYSNSDNRKPQPKADIYGEKAMLNGLIELTFKPEADTMKLFLHHMREQGGYRLIPVTVTDPKTATIADLKQDIKGRWRSNISCLLKDGQVLQEEEMISSYDLGENEVIEVVNATEELTIEAVGRNPITLMVDPNDISVEAVKEFITAQFNIPVDQQLLKFKEQDDVVDSKSFTHMLLTSRKTPVLIVSREEPVDADAIHSRSFNIGAEDARDTSATSCADQGSQAEDSCKANEGPNESGDNDQDGVAMLYGDKESVYKQFQEDSMDRKFSKKNAVTLLIQLKAKSKNAATDEASGKPKPKPRPRPKPFGQSGARPSRPKGCMSSLYPPETPD